MNPSPLSSPDLNVFNPSTTDPWDRPHDASLDLRGRLAYIAAMTQRRRRKRAMATWFVLATLMTAATGCVWMQ